MTGQATTPEGLRREAKGLLACGHDKETGARIGCDGTEAGCRKTDQLLSAQYFAEKRAAERQSQHLH